MNSAAQIKTLCLLALVRAACGEISPGYLEINDFLEQKFQGARFSFINAPEYQLRSARVLTEYVKFKDDWDQFTSFSLSDCGAGNLEASKRNVAATETESYRVGGRFPEELAPKLVQNVVLGVLLSHAIVCPASYETELRRLRSELATYTLEAVDRLGAQAERLCGADPRQPAAFRPAALHLCVLANPQLAAGYWLDFVDETLRRKLRPLERRRRQVKPVGESDAREMIRNIRQQCRKYAASLASLHERLAYDWQIREASYSAEFARHLRAYEVCEDMLAGHEESRAVGQLSKYQPSLEHLFGAKFHLSKLFGCVSGGGGGGGSRK